MIALALDIFVESKIAPRTEEARKALKLLAEATTESEREKNDDTKRGTLRRRFYRRERRKLIASSLPY
jgi:hypothetical protein